MAARHNTLMRTMELTKSKLQKKIHSHILNLHERLITIEELTANHFKKSIIRKKLKQNQQRRWRTHLKTGQYFTSLFIDIDAEHFEETQFH